MVMVAGEARPLAIVDRVPGVKRLSAPVADGLHALVDGGVGDGVGDLEDARRPGRVGVKRTKTWQVLGIEPAGAGEASLRRSCW